MLTPARFIATTWCTSACRFNRASYLSPSSTKYNICAVSDSRSLEPFTLPTVHCKSITPASVYMYLYDNCIYLCIFTDVKCPLSPLQLQLSKWFQWPSTKSRRITAITSQCGLSPGIYTCTVSIIASSYNYMPVGQGFADNTCLKMQWNYT